MAGLNLNALGAGLGQFAQDYRQQQAQAERSLMLQMQLAHYKQQMEKDQRDAAASTLALGFDPSSLGGGLGGGGTQMKPLPGMSTLTGPMPGGAAQPSGGLTSPPPSVGAAGEYGVGQGSATLQALLNQASSSALPEGYRAVVTSAGRPGARVAGTGGVSQHAHDNAIDVQIIGPQGPIPNTGDDTTGLYGRLAMAMRNAAPAGLQPKLAWGGNFTTGPANGPRDLMHFDLGGDRGRYGTLAQMGGGQTGPGNIDINNRPNVPNPAGGYSTDLSMSFNEDGREILISRVADDGSRILSPQEAIAQYHQTGKSYGTFDSPQSATAYGQQLHERQAARGGGQQLAQAAPAAPQASPPEPPPAPRDIALLLRKQNPTADSRSLISAASEISKRLQEDYKVNFDRWKAMTQFGGEAAGRAETGRHNVATEQQGQQRIGLETSGQAETGRHNVAGETAEGRRMTETERANRAREQNAAKAVQARVGKEQSKVDLATTELDTLASEAEQLAQMVEANPKLVGAKGIVGRTVGSVGEQLGILEEDPALAQFKSKVQILQSRLAKPLLGARYFSKPAQDRLNQLLPGMQRLDNPTAVVQSLRNVAGVLHTTSAATKAASGAVSTDVSKMTDDELRQGLGLGEPGQ